MDASTRTGALEGGAFEARARVGPLRTAMIAARLGFLMESNWAPLWGYMLLALVRPVALSLIVVVMYLVAGQRDAAILTYMFTGNAVFTFVGNVLFGINQVVIEDREHYQTLKYVCMAPVSIYAFLVGRGLTKVVIAAFSVTVTLLFGALALPVEISLEGVRWGLLLASTALGLTLLVFLGILLAGTSLHMTRQAGFISEALAGVLYLVSGAVFPPAVLPGFLAKIALALPTTWWVELMRRSLVPRRTVPTGLERYADPTLLAMLAAATVLFGVASVLGYRALERRARRDGKLDQRTDS